MESPHAFMQGQRVWALDCCSLPCAVLMTYGASLGQWWDGSVATSACLAHGPLPLPTLTGGQS